MEGRPGTPGRAEGRPGTPGTPGRAEGRPGTPGTPGRAEGRPGTPGGCPGQAEGPRAGGATPEEPLHMSCLWLSDGDGAGATPGGVVENGGGFGPGNGIGISPSPGALLGPVISPTPGSPVEVGPGCGVRPGSGVGPGLSPTPPTPVEGTSCSPPTSPGLEQQDGGPSGPAQLASGSDGAPGQLGPGPGSRRRGRGLRNSFTILERSQASGRPETRGLPVITWVGGATPGEGEAQQDPTLGEAGNAKQEDPTEAAPHAGTQEDPAPRDEAGWEAQEDPTGVGQEELEGCAESGREAQGDPTATNTGPEAREDPAEVQPHQEAQEDPSESGPQEQEDTSGGDEPGQGRPVSRRLTYIIKSRGPTGWEGGPRAEAQVRSRPGPTRLTSFAEQRQLKERRPGWGPQAGLRRSPGSRPGPEWAQVRQGLELKQEEIRARLQAREARLGRRWQSLGRRAYCRLLKLAGREDEAQAAPAPWEGSLAATQAQLQALGLQAGPCLGPSDGWAKPVLEMGQGAELGRGTGDQAQGEAARLGHSSAQQDPSPGAPKLLESGRQEGRELAVSPAERPEPFPLDWGSDPRPPTCQQEAVLRQRRGESRREPLEPGWRLRPRARPDRDGERLPPGSALPPAEPPGLKLFKEPSTKSNRLILHNALTYCCLAGKVNETQRGDVLRELVSCDHVQCLILLRDRRCQFRALYSLSGAGHIQRLWGTGPRAITMDMIDGLYKYNSDRKQFHLIPSKIMSPNVDALTIHGHLWSARKRAGQGGERR